MAKINDYYDIKNSNSYIDYGVCLLNSLQQWLSDMFLLGGTDNPNGSTDLGVVYSDNGEAFRKRTDDTADGNLRLPFINFIQKGMDLADNTFDWYNTPLDKRGVYVSELQTKVRQVPIKIEFEATFWCALAKEMRYVANQLAFFRENHTDIALELEYTFTNFDGDEVAVTIPHYIKINFPSISVDPQYERDAWLEENIKHSIEMDFEVITWGIIIDGQNISITDKAILRFTDRENIVWRKEIEVI